MRVVAAKRALEDCERALKEAARLGRVAEGAVRIPEVVQRHSNLAVVAAVLSLLDHERSLEEFARFGCVAEADVRSP